MKRRTFCYAAGSLLVALSGSGCAHLGSDWATLIDGDKGLDNFNRIGDANWRAEGGAIVADKGKGGHLVSKKSYKDFELKVEFYAETTTNSGVFIRASDPKKVGADNAYEVNIYDQRPGQEYATGAIVNHGKVPVPIIHRAAGKWNTFEISAKGTQVTVVFNGTVSTSIQNDKYASGPITLQFGNGAKGAPGGAIKFRKVQIRELQGSGGCMR